MRSYLSMPNFKSISFKMAVLQGGGQIPCGIGLNKNNNVHVPKFSRPLVRKLTAANSLADQFTRNLCPNGIKKKSEILETLGGRVLEFWLPV